MTYYISKDGEFPGSPVLGFHAFTIEGPGSIPGPGTKILQVPQYSSKKKKKITKMAAAVAIPSHIIFFQESKTYIPFPYTGINLHDYFK